MTDDKMPYGNASPTSEEVKTQAIKKQTFKTKTRQKFKQHRNRRQHWRDKKEAQQTHRARASKERGNKTHWREFANVRILWFGAWDMNNKYGNESEQAYKTSESSCATPDKNQATKERRKLYVELTFHVDVFIMEVKKGSTYRSWRNNCLQ